MVTQIELHFSFGFSSRLSVVEASEVYHYKTRSAFPFPKQEADVG